MIFVIDGEQATPPIKSANNRPVSRFLHKVSAIKQIQRVIEEIRVDLAGGNRFNAPRCPDSSVGRAAD